MGVQRIPLRLPRAAPVPLRPGSSSSSSISPCIPSSPSYPSLPTIPCLTSPGQSFAPTATQSSPEEVEERPQSLPWRHSPTPSKSSPFFTAVKQKIFLDGSRAKPQNRFVIHKSSIHVSRNFCTLHRLRADHT